MARDRRRFAKEEGATAAGACASAPPSNKPLARNRQAPQHPTQQDDPAREEFRHFLRALAREAARRDHAADPD
jgi:hypothetical protein